MTRDQIIEEFLLDLSSKSPVPGGGGASALAGAFGVSLGMMVASLTIGKKRYAAVEEEVIRLNQSYRLCMVGSGELSDAVYELVEEYGLTKKVKRLEKIPNDDIWELYRIADCFVNLNRHEIYGMVLLEAMFYGCKVIAWNAPGPDFIIRDGVTGYLTDSLEKTVRLILDSKPVAEQSRAAILSDFTWKKTAGIITELAGEEKRL